MNWTDIAVIVIIGFSMYYGWKKGFIVAAIDFVKWIAAIVIARMFHVQFTTFVTENFWDPTKSVGKHVTAFLYDMLGFDPMTGQSITIDQMNASLEKLKLPEVLEKTIYNAVNEKVISTSVEFVEEIATHMTEMIVNGIGFLVLILILLSIFGFAQFIGNMIAKLPIIKELNHGGGLILGAMIGIVTVYFIMAVLSYIPTFKWSRDTVSAIEQSQFAIYFYKYNILQYVFNTVIINGSLNL